MSKPSRRPTREAPKAHQEKVKAARRQFTQDTREPEYLDEGISGARLDRPALDRSRDNAQRGEFDAVVI